MSMSEKRRLYYHNYYLKNKDKRHNYYLLNKKKRQKDSQQHQSELKRMVILHYSGGKIKCKKCGFSDLRALSIDHINGGGSKHQKEIKGSLYNWIFKNNFPENMFQVLCMNCQWIKRYESKELQRNPQQEK